jgi:hypothetical protein
MRRPLFTTEAQRTQRKEDRHAGKTGNEQGLGF